MPVDHRGTAADNKERLICMQPTHFRSSVSSNPGQTTESLETDRYEELHKKLLSGFSVSVAGFYTILL